MQHFLFNKKNLLYKKKILYIVANSSVNHHNISWQAIKHFYFDKNKQTVDTLIKEISLNKNYNILISSENLENLKFSNEFNKFIINIKKNHNIKIVWAIREQFSYSLSLLSMLLNKGAYLKNFDLFIDSILKKGKLTLNLILFGLIIMSNIKIFVKHLK